MKLGRTPTTDEIPFLEALLKTYGSMKEACMVAGIQYRKPGQTHSQYRKPTKYTKPFLIETLARFHEANGRWPKRNEVNSKIWSYAHKNGGMAHIKVRALAYDGVYKKTDIRGAQVHRYTQEELLRFLTRFEEINKRRPSYSDAKRGLLPHLSRYSYNFGSWKNALSLAFKT